MSKIPDDDLRITRVTPIRNGQFNQDSFEKLWEELKNFLGGKGGGTAGGGANRGSPMHQKQMGFYLMVGVVLLVAMLTSFFTIDISEEGVITRFGSYNRTVSPGFHMKLPFGMEGVQKVLSKRVLQEEFGFRTSDSSKQRTEYSTNSFIHESLMLTGDLNVANVEWILQYRISDPWKYLFHAKDVRLNIRDVSLSIMRRVVGDRLVGDVLTTGRVEIADEAKNLTQSVLDVYDMGIRVERIILQGVNPPETVKPAFNEVNAAKQEQEQTINNAEREYNRLIPEAKGQADKLLSDAEGFAIDAKNRAEGDAHRFVNMLTAYQESPDLTRKRLYIETMEEIYQSINKVTIVDPAIKGLLPVFDRQLLSPSGNSSATSQEPSPK